MESLNIENFKRNIQQYLNYDNEIKRLQTEKKLKEKEKKKMEERVKEVLVQKDLEVNLSNGTLKVENVETVKGVNKKHIIHRVNMIYQDENEKKNFLDFIYNPENREKEVVYSLKLE